MKYQVDGEKHKTLEESILCIRSLVRRAKEENKVTFTIDTNYFD